MKTKLEHFIHSAGFTSCLASIASILMGLLVGLVLLYACLLYTSDAADD